LETPSRICTVFHLHEELQVGILGQLLGDGAKSSAVLDYSGGGEGAEKSGGEDKVKGRHIVTCRVLPRYSIGYVSRSYLYWHAHLYTSTPGIRQGVCENSDLAMRKKDYLLVYFTFITDHKKHFTFSVIDT